MSTLTERLASIETHLKTIETESIKDFAAVEAAVHAELAKLEAAVLVKISEIKNAATKV